MLLRFARLRYCHASFFVRTGSLAQHSFASLTLSLALALHYLYYDHLNFHFPTLHEMADSSLSSQLPLQSYSKDVPPGWKPRPYSIAKWKELLAIWLRLTRLDPEQLGAAIISRLEGPAWQTAMNLADYFAAAKWHHRADYLPWR